MYFHLVLLLTLFPKLSEQSNCGSPCFTDDVTVCIQFAPPPDLEKKDTQEYLKLMTYKRMPNCEFDRLVCRFGSNKGEIQGASIVPMGMCDIFSPTVDQYENCPLTKYAPNGGCGRRGRRFALGLRQSRLSPSTRFKTPRRARVTRQQF